MALVFVTADLPISRIEHFFKESLRPEFAHNGWFLVSDPDMAPVNEDSPPARLPLTGFQNGCVNASWQQVRDCVIKHERMNTYMANLGASCFCVLDERSRNQDTVQWYSLIRMWPDTVKDPKKDGYDPYKMESFVKYGKELHAWDEDDGCTTFYCPVRIPFRDAAAVCAQRSCYNTDAMLANWDDESVREGDVVVAPYLGPGDENLTETKLKGRKEYNHNVYGK